MESQLSPVGRFRKILLAFDGTEHSDGARALAMSLAQHCGAELLVLRVVLTNPEYESMAPQRVDAETREVEKSLETLQQEAEKQGIECRVMLRHGADPCIAVVRLAEDENVDCVVVGRRHRSDLARLVVGDSTNRIIGHAPCSVLVAPRGSEPLRRRILVATDGSRHADAACATAARLALSTGLPLTVLSATLGDESDERRSRAKEAVQRVLYVLKQELAPAGIELDGMVEQGRPEAVIVDVARSRSADLVVMGSHGHTALKRLFMGSVSKRVVGNAPCPVLIVR
ncbi:MAG: universal stress protein [Chromatiaceae bacterium]|nr:MAG: universal stress protein [Chromatiaceae bacterium]